MYAGTEEVLAEVDDSDSLGVQSLSVEEVALLLRRHGVLRRLKGFDSPTLGG